MSGCAESRFLFQRGWDLKKRVEYIERNEDKYSEREIYAFKNNNIELGLPKELLTKMIGKPDKKKSNDSLWIYTYQDTVTLLKIEFKDDKATSFSY